MKTEILLVTHAKDIPYLRFALQSLKKFGSGFSGVTVLYPAHQREQFSALEARWYLEAPIVSPENFPIRPREFDEFQPKGMNDHMAQICLADQHCPDADFILHTDSDCVFREPFTPEDYFAGGKPVLLCEPYAWLKTVHPGRFHWQGVVNEALGFEPSHECMCRPGGVYPRALYGLLRDFMEKRWRMPLRNYILACKNDFPQGFAEFNTLGAFAMKFHPEMFHWIELPKEARPRDKMVQFWSHRSPDQLQDIWIDGKEVTVLPELLIKEILDS